MSTLSESKSSDPVETLLMEDYRYLSESFWKNEQTGETRVNWYIGIVTAVFGGMGALLSSEFGPEGEDLRLIALVAFGMLLTFGVVNLLRIQTRNETTDRYKLGLDRLRQLYKDRFDSRRSLTGYYPIESPDFNEGWLKKFMKMSGLRSLRKLGGLAHTVAAINSIIGGILVGVSIYPNAKPPFTPVFTLATGRGEVIQTFLVTALTLFIVQFIYVSVRESMARRKHRTGEPKISFGIVYRNTNEGCKYLMVSPTDRNNEWVLPKGHIEKGEGHGEAAVREVREESGVVARLCALVADQIQIETDGKEVSVKFYLLEYLFEGKPRPDEKRKIDWFDFDRAMKELQYEESKFALKKAHAMGGCL